MQQIHFDENLKGFHGYDFDITIQSTLAGFTNYVAYDISLEHLSRGKPDKNYFKNLIIIFKKWEAQLPLIGLNISEEKKNKIPKFEKKRLKVLINRMIKTGFETKEILNETNYYRQLIGKTETRDIQAFLYFNIFFTRLFTRPKHFFKK
ncbi:hypothetical protein SDC9_146844 [bioreactor metagenome]|uniref:Uncharacterized protein n=1 Tax=bioreactor metagenome TaxID=1076179 RepID=A0A645EEF0_9ZZZZ